jgi:hypothetical protein
MLVLWGIVRYLIGEAAEIKEVRDYERIHISHKDKEAIKIFKQESDLIRLFLCVCSAGNETQALCMLAKY